MDYLMCSGETCFMRTIFLFCTFKQNIRFKCVFDCHLLQSICSNTTPVVLNRLMTTFLLGISYANIQAQTSLLHPVLVSIMRGVVLLE